MDLIIALIKAIVEAFEESQGRKRKPVPDPMPDSEPSLPPPNPEREARAIQQRVLDKQQALLRQRQAEAEQQQQTSAPSAPVEPPRVAARPTGAQRLGRLLRQPQTARELILLSEIIGPPRSLRRGRH